MHFEDLPTRSHRAAFFACISDFAGGVKIPKRVAPHICVAAGLTHPLGFRTLANGNIGGVCCDAAWTLEILQLGWHFRRQLFLRSGGARTLAVVRSKKDDKPKTVAHRRENFSVGIVRSSRWGYEAESRLLSQFLPHTPDPSTARRPHPASGFRVRVREAERSDAQPQAGVTLWQSLLIAAADGVLRVPSKWRDSLKAHALVQQRSRRAINAVSRRTIGTPWLLAYSTNCWSSSLARPRAAKLRSHVHPLELSIFAPNNLMPPTSGEECRQRRMTKNPTPSATDFSHAEAMTTRSGRAAPGAHRAPRSKP